MKRLNQYKFDFFIILGFLLLPLLLFGDVTLGGKTMLPVDNLFQWQPWQSAAASLGVGAPQNGLILDLIIENYAWKQFARETFLAGDIPLWNPYLFAGVPFLAAGQHSMYYPFSVLFLVLPLSAAYGWYTVSQLWLAGVLMYVYGRILGLKRSSAFLAGLTYQGGGFIVVSAAVFPMIVGAVPWLPLLLGCIEKVVQGAKSRGQGQEDNNQQSTFNNQLLTGDTQTLTSTPESPILWIVLGAVGLGMQILAGHIEYTIYTLLVMGLYGAWRLVRVTGWRWEGVKGGIRPFFSLSAMVLIGLMLGSLQLVPLYELADVNFRQESATFDDVRGYAFEERRVLTLLMPNFFGNPAHHEYRDVLSGDMVPFETNYNGQPKNNSEWGLKNYVEGGIYLGVLPLFLALLGVWAGWRSGKVRRNQTLFFGGLGLFSLAFIFGTPLYAILYYGLPFIEQLNTPFRWVFPLSLCVAVLVGFGAEKVQGARCKGQGRTVNSQRTTDNGQRITDYGLSITLLTWIAFVVGLLTLAGLLLSRVFYARLEPMIERVFLGLANATVGFGSARAFYSYTFWQVLIFGVMLVGVGVVLWVGGRWKRPFTLLAAALIIVDIFLANQGFHAAVDPALLDYKPELVQWLEQQPGEWRLTSFNPNGDIPFHANSGWLFNLEDVRGYDSIIPLQYTNFMRTIETQQQLDFNRIQPIANWESLNSPLLDVLTVKYIITTETVELPKLQLVWEGEGVRVYENLAVAPRAYTLPLTATVVTDNQLAALSNFDPRQYVIVGTEEWGLGTGDYSPTPSPYSLAPLTYYSNREVLVETAVTQPSWLILNDSYFPGWNAYARPVGTGEDAEKQIDVVLVNGNFRGVKIEPGEWAVRFRYSPPSFWLGGLGSLMAIIILAFAVVVWGWGQFYRPNGKTSLTRSLAKNSLAPMALSLFNKGIDFAYAIYYLRVLGPADAGSFQTAITTAMIFEIISNFGLDLLLIRDVSQDRDKASHYLLNTTLLRLGAALIASLPVVILIVGADLFNREALTSAEIMATALIMLGMVFSGMSKGVTGLFYIHEQAEVPATMTTVTTILKVGFGVVALLLGYGFVGLAAVSIITNIITMLLLSVIALRRYTIQGPWRVDWTLQREMVRKGFPLMLIHLLQTVFISVDVLLLRLQLGETVGREIVGWYSSAYKWFNALQVVPSFFTLALFPIITREIQQSMDSARRMYQMSIKLMLLLALPIAAVTFFLAHPLVQLLAGDEFLPHGAIALQLVILSIPIGWMNSVTNYVLIGLGLEGMQPRAFTIAVAFNIIANLIFIPRYNYVAAAVTTILSEVVLLVVFEYYLRKRMDGVNWGGFLLRPLLITALMFAGMYLGAQLHMVVGLILGIIIYPAGLLLLGILGIEERKVLGKILPVSIANRFNLD